MQRETRQFADPDQLARQTLASIQHILDLCREASLEGDYVSEVQESILGLMAAIVFADGRNRAALMSRHRTSVSTPFHSTHSSRRLQMHHALA
jgi:hypothetical protein